MVLVIKVFPERDPCNCLAHGSFFQSLENAWKSHALHSWGALMKDPL